MDLKDELSKIDAHTGARRILGAHLIRRLESGGQLVGRIVEAESYEETDRSAHSYGGPRGRNLVMFGPAGYAYVYFTYGMHYCMNVVVGKEGRGEAVLIRALEPVRGREFMRENRPAATDPGLTNGPAKLTQALQIEAEFNGHDLSKPPLEVHLKEPLLDDDITITTRVGIRHNAEYMQRFYITGNRWVSKQ